MAGSSWPALIAGARAKASEVEAKFDWIEGDVVPMTGGVKTDATYDLGESSFRWRDVYWSRQALAAVGSVGTPSYSFAGRTTDGWFSPSANQITITLNGAAEYNFTATNLRAGVDAGASIGSATNRFSQYFAGDGSAAACSFAFGTAGNGLFKSGANYISLASNSTEGLRLTPNQQIAGVNGSAALPTFSWISSATKGMYRTASDEVSLVNGANDAILIDTAGVVSKPLQPSFLAYNSVSDSNVTGDGTVATVEFDTEITDQNSDFNNTTDTFTAPKTGVYQFNTSVYATNIGDGTHTTAELHLVTSNRTYEEKITGTPLYVVSKSLQLSVLADMDSADTATITLMVTPGSKNTNSNGGASPIRSFFSGSLIN